MSLIKRAKKSAVGTALATGGFGVGQVTQLTDVHVSPPLGYQHEAEYVDQVCKELKEQTILVRCWPEVLEWVE